MANNPRRLNFESHGIENSGDEQNSPEDRQESLSQPRGTSGIGNKILRALGMRRQDRSAEYHLSDYALQMNESIAPFEDVIAPEGSPLELSIWQATSQRFLTSLENIPEAFYSFAAEEQCEGEYEPPYLLTQKERREYELDARNLQRESLKPWINHFTDENCEYPLWFRTYALEGLSRMGLPDEKSHTYRERGKDNPSAYPVLDKLALDRVYDIVCDIYNEEAEIAGSNGVSSDAFLEQLIHTDSFNGTYSHFQLASKSFVSTPEQMDSVKSVWVERRAGDEADIAAASAWTPWYTKNTASARACLGSTTDPKGESSSQSKFLMLHIQNPQSKVWSSNALAMIHIDANGQIAEIYGNGEDGDIEEVLLPQIEAMVKTLPNGDEYAQAFADKKRLFALQHKVENGEKLSSNDLNFIYEIDKPIASFVGGREDLQIYKLRSTLDISTVLESGIDPDKLYASLHLHEAVEHIDDFLERGAKIDVDALANQLLDARAIYPCVEALLRHDADPNKILRRMRNDGGDRCDPELIAEHFDLFMQCGADAKLLCECMWPCDVAKNYDTFAQHGVRPDIDVLMNDMHHEICALLRGGNHIEFEEIISGLKGYASPQMIENIRNFEAFQGSKE